MFFYYDHKLVNFGLAVDNLAYNFYYIYIQTDKL